MNINNAVDWNEQYGYDREHEEPVIIDNIGDDYRAVVLDGEQIQALLGGKVVTFMIEGEYRVFLKKGGEHG